MRRASSIAKATALEILSEPLTLLVLLVALALAILAPVFHYHQFGEATRMARDAGLSAVFTCGSVLAVFGTIRAFRREIESGTLEMALSHPVSRRMFFLAKTAGALLAYLVVVLTVFGVLVTMVNGAVVGGRIAEETGTLARVWGPSVAVGAAVLLVPLVLGALLNRFGRFRFVLTALGSAFVLSLLSFIAFSCWLGWGDALRLLTAFGLLVAFALLLLSAAAAFSIRFEASAATSLAGLLLAILLPFVGNYYLAESLSNGGVIPSGYALSAALAILPAVAAFLILGVKWTNERT